MPASQEAAMRLFERMIACGVAAAAVAMILAVVGCKYETGPPDYPRSPDYSWGTGAGAGHA